MGYGVWCMVYSFPNPYTRNRGGGVSRSLPAGAYSAQHGSWCRGPGLGLRIVLLSDFGFRASGFGCQVSGLGFLGVSGFGVSFTCFMSVQVLSFKFWCLCFRF